MVVTSEKPLLSSTKNSHETNLVVNWMFVPPPGSTLLTHLQVPWKSTTIFKYFENYLIVFDLCTHPNVLHYIGAEVVFLIFEGIVNFAGCDNPTQVLVVISGYSGAPKVHTESKRIRNYINTIWSECWRRRNNITKREEKSYICGKVISQVFTQWHETSEPKAFASHLKSHRT